MVRENNDKDGCLKIFNFEYKLTSYANHSLFFVKKTFTMLGNLRGGHPTVRNILI